MIEVLLLALSIILYAAQGDPVGEGDQPCLDLDGATRAQVIEMFGRPPDHVEDYGDLVRPGESWYFGDDDEAEVNFSSESPGALVVGWVYRDGDDLMTGRPDCPLSESGPDHPARFNIEAGG